MVKGLDLFRRHFQDYADQYLIIGGTACTLSMEELGEDFRATKDLDIVLSIEALSKDFVKAFWDFVLSGGYSRRQESTGKKIFYRFSHPADETYPFMLELFSRAPDVFSHPVSGHLTPIPMEDEVSSLSAILLDDEYYDFMVKGRRLVNGISTLAPQYIIPLKTRAWQDLSERREVDESISKSNIKKHQNDVFRLFRIFNPDDRLILPDGMKENMSFFLETMGRSKVDIKPFGYGKRALEPILEEIRNFYGIGN